MFIFTQQQRFALSQANFTVQNWNILKHTESCQLNTIMILCVILLQLVKERHTNLTTILDEAKWLQKMEKTGATPQLFGIAGKNFRFVAKCSISAFI